jgi:hypothetical protein
VFLSERVYFGLVASLAPNRHPGGANWGEDIVLREQVRTEQYMYSLSSLRKAHQRGPEEGGRGVCTFSPKSRRHDRKLASKGGAGSPGIGVGKIGQFISIHSPFKLVHFWFILQPHHTPPSCLFTAASHSSLRGLNSRHGYLRNL